MDLRNRKTLNAGIFTGEVSDAARLLAASALALSLAACGGSSSPSGDSASNVDGSSGTGSSGSTGSDSALDEPASGVSSENGLVINELLAGDLAQTTSGELDDPWVELYNRSGNSIALDGYSLQITGVEDGSWDLPDVTIASGGFLRLWDVGKDELSPTEVQTSFPLMGLSSLTLVDAANKVVDRVSGVEFPTHQSWARYPDGADAVRFSSEPTPGRANQDAPDAFSLNCDYMTLTAGSEFTLRTTPEVPVSWHSGGSIVQVDSNGVLSTTASGIAGEAEPVVVTATDMKGNSRECNVTVANWKANISKLAIVGHPRADFLLKYLDGGIYFTIPGQLHRADDGFKNPRQVGSFPPTPSSPVMLKTQYGHFASSGENIYSTQDFQSWNTELAMSHINLQHGFSSHFDRANLTEYLYAGEYSVESSEEHAVHRGVNTGANTSWSTVMNWGAEQDFYDDNSQLDTIRHVHAVVTDPYTGHIYVATGDVDQHSRLYFSNNNGDSFQLLAMGSQKYRSLSIWFTERYVYWNMDSERADQHVYRLARSMYDRHGTWPTLTPELSSGMTTVGTRYLVIASHGGKFPAAVGNFFYETEARALSASERVMAVEDPQYDYSESVADLTHSSQWYHLWVKDQRGDDVLIMGTSAEGTEPDLRDHNSRVFGFKERSDGSVDVQELLNMPSVTPGEPNRFTQLIPAMQDGDGYIYFRGRETAHRIYKTRLHWVDSET